jgi:hypothetical protein
MGASYSRMDESKRRRLSIARELKTWAGDLPRVLSKIDRVLKLSYITEAQAADIESIAELVRTVLLELREAVEADDYDRMIASVDRLHEGITTADATLDRLLTPKATD